MAAIAFLLLACHMYVTQAMVTLASHGDANAWHRASSSDLCLLPFPMADGLLPGEHLQMHLAEASQLNLFSVAMQRHSGCVAQLLERRSASSPDVKSYCAVAPLLEVREHRDCDDGGIWCSLTCVSAVQLEGVELRTIEEQYELDGVDVEEAVTHHDDDDDEAPFLVARARLLQEAARTPRASIETAEAEVSVEASNETLLASDVRQLHEQVNALRRLALELNPDGPVTNSDRITSGGERIGPPPAADDRVTDGAYRLGPLIGPYISADELSRLRLDAASVRGVDEPPPLPHDDSNRLNELWGTADSASLYRRALSLIAVEGLHESYRMAAAAIDDTPSRLQHALKGLKARQAALTAEVALRRAGGGAGGGAGGEAAG